MDRKFLSFCIAICEVTTVMEKEFVEIMVANYHRLHYDCCKKSFLFKRVLISIYNRYCSIVILYQDREYCLL